MNFTEMNTPNLKSVFATVGGNKYLTTIKYWHTMNVSEIEDFHLEITDDIYNK